MREKTLWIVRTAVLTALLVVLQAVTAPAGQLVTGSCVNAVLAVAVLAAGLASGLTVALISPFCAFLVGVGPQLIALIPAIAVGNAVLVVLLHLLVSKAEPFWKKIPGAVIAACAKALVLWLLVVKLLCSVLTLPEPQVAKFGAMFSWPQLVTALIGCAVALLIVPVIRKTVRQ